MKKKLAILITAILFTMTLSSPAAADRSDDWGALADQAITAFEAADAGNETPHAYAYIMGAIARRHGWQDPRIAIYLNKLYSLRNPDGGWGLNFTYDKFSDGTVNPANTTYTVTLADHIGPVFLDAYQAGVVPASDIATIVNLILTTQVGTWSTAGRCVAYSRHSNDAVNTSNGRCVYNVNALAAMFLQLANGAGFNQSGLHRRVSDMSKNVLNGFNYQTLKWPWYTQAGSPPQDTDHNAATAEALYLGLAYGIGREVTFYHMDNALADNNMSPIAHMRLTGLPPGPGSTSGTTTIWCVMGDNWLSEAQSFVNSPPNNRARAQAAYWAARNSEVC
jgi:hypothetical protein